VWLFGHSFGDVRSKVRAALARCACAGGHQFQKPFKIRKSGHETLLPAWRERRTFGNTNANARIVFEGNRSSAMYRHILIPTDGSALAEKAVAHGLSLARAVGAKVTALIVETPFSVYNVPESRLRRMSDAFAEHAEQIKRHAAAVLSHVADAAKAAGVACDTLQMEHDHPYKAIITTAVDKGCDVIVMASHGRGGLSAILLGSTTNKVLTHTNIPVLVCR
jgi:nucleotide-binding universal stress UspA family protein